MAKKQKKVGVRRRRQTGTECFLTVFKEEAGTEYVAVRVTRMPFLPAAGLLITVGETVDGIPIDFEVESAVFDLASETLDVTMDAGATSLADLKRLGFMVDVIEVLKPAPADGNVLSFHRMTWQRAEPKPSAPKAPPPPPKT